MRTFLALAISAVAVLSTCQAQAVHRHHRVIMVRPVTHPAEGPFWYYSRPMPLGAVVTTVRDMPGHRCYSRLVENRRGWYVPHRWCEARP
jgi:hypothetical protein